MKTGFVLPSCNYNIVLSEEDLKQLLERGFICKDPNRIIGTFRDDHLVCHDTNGHNLIYQDQYDRQYVQFVGISLERPNSHKEDPK